MNARLAVRRTATAVALAATALAVAAGPAAAQPAPRPNAADRVIVSSAGGLVLQPDSSAAGARVRAVARIGKADATPDSQVWRSERARQGRGAVNFVHAPSTRGADARPLCVDVLDDSLQAGAPLVLRPCDGTESQAWRQLSTISPAFFQNLESGLKMEVVAGALVQAEFPARDAADRRQRTNAQLFAVPPKSFGIGGA